MRLTLPKALMLALLANLLLGCERSYADRQEAVHDDAVVQGQAHGH